MSVVKKSQQDHIEEITIHVTLEDIKNAERYNSRRCPIAMAAMREYDFTYVQMTPNYFGVTDKIAYQRRIYQPSKVAIKFVQSWDATGKALPRTFTFELDYVKPCKGTDSNPAIRDRQKKLAKDRAIRDGKLTDKQIKERKTRRNKKARGADLEGGEAG